MFHCLNVSVKNSEFMSFRVCLFLFCWSLITKINQFKPIVRTIAKNDESSPKINGTIVRINSKYKKKVNEHIFCLVSVSKWYIRKYNFWIHPIFIRNFFMPIFEHSYFSVDIGLFDYININTNNSSNLDSRVDVDSSLSHFSPKVAWILRLLLQYWRVKVFIQQFGTNLSIMHQHL